MIGRLICWWRGHRYAQGGVVSTYVTPYGYESWREFTCTRCNSKKLGIEDRSFIKETWP